MNSIKYLSTISFIALFCLNCQAQQPQTIAAPEELNEVKERIVQMVDNKEMPSMSVAVIKGDQLIWQESFGFANIENQVKATPQTIYALGSMSKSVSATAVMTMVESGKVSLDAPVNDLISPMKLHSDQWDTDQIKLWQLLNMSAGIGHGWETRKVENRKEYDKEASFNDYAKVLLPPGAVNHYSNFSIGVTEAVIENTTGETLENFLQQHVFKPLKMTHSMTQYDEHRKGEFATPYSSRLNTIKPYDFYPLTSAGFYSSISDLVNYARLYMNSPKVKHILKPTTRSQMTDFDQGPKGIFGLGWGKVGDLIVTNGAISGANSCLLIIPSKGIGIICLTNFSSPNSIADEVAFQTLMTLVPDFPLMEMMGEFEQTYRTPYAVSDDLKGTWTGEVQTAKGPMAMAMEFSSEGDIFIKIGSCERKALANSTFNKMGTLEASFRGIVPAKEYNPENEVNVRVLLQKVGDEFTGYLSPEVSNSNGTFSYPVGVSLKKQ